MHAGAGLGHHLLPFGKRLVVQHERVAPLFAEVGGKGVSTPHGLEPRIFFQPGLGHDGAGVGLCGGTLHGFAAAEARPDLVYGAQVAVVLERKVLAPHGRIVDLIGQFNHAEERVACFLLALKNRHQKCGGAGSCQRGRDRRHKDQLGSFHWGCPILPWHLTHPVGSPWPGDMVWVNAA